MVEQLNEISLMSLTSNDWAFRWKELVALVPQYKLAKLAVEKLCRLYRQDVECLPYDVPECREVSL